MSVIRGPRSGDQSFIAATWARSMLSTHAHQRHMRSRTGRQIGQQIDAVLDRPDTRALLSVKAHDPNVIHGWILYVEGPGVPVVHYCYCRKKDADGAALRGRGIVTEMLDRIGVRRDSGVVCTSFGPDSTILRGRYKASVHLPLVDFLKPGEL
jgi:hypothetical protein